MVSRISCLCVTVITAVLAPAALADARVADPCLPQPPGIGGWCGDGGPATEARLSNPSGVAATVDGGVLIADSGNDTVRRVSRRGIITRIAGIGVPGDSGDGDLAIGARLEYPTCVVELPDRSVLVQTNHHLANGALLPGPVRRISRGGTITTVQGEQACRAQLLPDGAQLVVEGNQVKSVAADGTRTVVAGTPGCRGTAGDGGPAVAARLDHPAAVAAVPGGGFLIADSGSDLVRRVGPNGVIDTVAGRDAGAPGEPDSSGMCPLRSGRGGGPPNILQINGPLKASRSRPYTLRITTTNPGVLTVTLQRPNRRAYRATASVPDGGIFKVPLPRITRRGAFRVTVAIKGKRRVNGKRVAFSKRDSATLRVG